MLLMHELKYINITSLNHRKDYGQFFTPLPIARLMAKWIMKCNPKTVLDPAFGLGVFYDEVIKLNPENELIFRGYEIDEYILKYFNNNSKRLNCSVFHIDYLETHCNRFDAIICNPPYMRFQKFLKRHDVLPKIEKTTGKKLIGYSNISSVFLVKSLQELTENGNLAYIMPFEFFNTGYGTEIKKCLLENHLLKQIIIFSNEKEIFPDATTTVCILLCKNDNKEEPIKITAIKTNEEIDSISDISNFYQRKILASDLPFNKKWTPIIRSLFSEQEIPEDFCKLSFYGIFTRGIATGANSFFSLSKSKIEKWRLDENNICKCITKSSQLREAIFTEPDFDKLYNSDKPVYCLDVKNHANQQIIKYLMEGERLGYNRRYLTRTRNIWYKIEHRKPAPILFGVFNRGRLKVVRNFTEAINFTCFHCFYPNMFGLKYVDRLFVYFLSDIGQNIIKTNRRRYGDELDKFEPGDLNDCLCPNQNQFDNIDDKDVEEVLCLAKTNKEEAIQLSNIVIETIINAGQENKQNNNYFALQRSKAIS